jgi:hypothetical protein
VNSNRLGPRRLAEPDRGGRRRPAAPPRQGQDKTGLIVGLAVGGGVLVLALAFAMSGSSTTEKARVDRSADRSLKEDMEAAQKLAENRKLAEALAALDTAIQNPAYRSSNLLPKARTQADQYRKQLLFEREAAAAIDEFDKKITASKANKTAMKQADAFWSECNFLLSKYGNTAKSGILNDWRADLERWRGTMAQDDWQKEFPYTRDRIKAHVDAERFGPAVKEWRQFSERFSSSELKSKIESELIMINKSAAAAASKLVQSAGSGPGAKAMLEDALERFNETDGQKVIVQKLKTLN